MCDDTSFVHGVLVAGSKSVSLFHLKEIVGVTHEEQTKLYMYERFAV